MRPRHVWIERVPLDAHFAGKTRPVHLDRIKAMIRQGWDLTVLTVRDEHYVLVLGCWQGVKGRGA